MLRDLPPRLPVLLIAVLLGCGGDDGGTPPSTTAIAKASASGDAQSGVVGQPLANPIQVLVTQSGAPAAGVAVAWSTTVPGASLAATSTTDPSGVASTSWTLGTVSGSQVAQASLSGASGSPVSFSATAAPDVAVALEKFSGDEQEGVVGAQLGAPLVAQVSDQFGNGVPGVAVAWAASAGSVSAASVPTGPSGTSSVNVTLPATVGPITITATSGTLAGSPQTFTANAGEPGPATARVSVTNNAFTPASLTIAAGTTVVWSWAAGAFGHNVVPDNGTVPAGSGGLQNAPADYEFTFNTPGTYAYHCAAHGAAGGIGMSGTITVQ